LPSNIAQRTLDSFQHVLMAYHPDRLPTTSATLCRNSSPLLSFSLLSYLLSPATIATNAVLTTTPSRCKNGTMNTVGKCLVCGQSTQPSFALFDVGYFVVDSSLPLTPAICSESPCLAPNADIRRYASCYCWTDAVSCYTPDFLCALFLQVVDVFLKALCFDFTRLSAFILPASSRTITLPNCLFRQLMLFLQVVYLAECA
jgi:hypothetical protein